MNVENYLYGLNFKENNQTFKRKNVFALKIEKITFVDRENLENKFD